MIPFLTIWATWCLATALAAPSASPLVKTPHQGTFQGLFNSTSNVEAFYGIPFAKPPVGELRFAKPKKLEAYSKKDVRDATKLNKACLQSGRPDASVQSDEDCLYLQVHRPQGTKKGDDLPVMLWIYGGAWNTGSTQAYGYPHELIKQSVKLNKKVIHVAGEYRLGALGFLAGAQVAEASRNGSATTNAGYWDQREVMRWVQENIHSFGGDPKKVTIFGQSAGAGAVGVHLIANDGNTEGLFRAAILQSGAAATGARYGPTDERPQKSYDQLLQMTNCTNIPCLRGVDAATLQKAVTAINLQSYEYGYPGWVPLKDDYFIQGLPSERYAKGKIANVPIIAGVNLDEGTIFGQWAANVTTDEDFIKGILVPLSNQTRPLIPQLLKLHPNDGVSGSPYRPELLGSAPDDRYFAPQSQFKRVASIFGDWAFHAPAHQLLDGVTQENANKQKAWAYLFSQPTSTFYNTAKFRGVSHGSEIAYVYNYPAAPLTNATAGSAEEKYCNETEIKQVAQFMSSAWIHFAHDLDPNHDNKDSINWPSYTSTAKKHNIGKFLNIQGGNITSIGADYRKDQVSFYLKHKDTYLF
ncbi:unnamed protein product [Sympodiomycopsis kandeliae]